MAVRVSNIGGEMGRCVHTVICRPPAGATEVRGAPGTQLRRGPKNDVFLQRGHRPCRIAVTGYTGARRARTSFPQCNPAAYNRVENLLPRMPCRFPEKPFA